jgi:ACS family hexuronate transporter-like MFS transporter
MLEAQGTKSVAVTEGFKINGLRWWIVSLIFLATLINYIDRQTLSVLAPLITKDLGLNNTQFAGIVTWFLLAYTISQGLSGKLYDRIGTRLGFVVSITVWSLAAIMHSFARGLVSLSLVRFVLGLGEAGNWPGAAKTVAEWFPVRQRALGMAIFNSGAAIGAMIAPPVIVWLQRQVGWPKTFVVTGMLGFGWLVLWLLFYQSPKRHRWITDEELQLIEEGKEERLGDGETGRQGDGESGRQGDAENRLVTASACLSVPASSSLPVTPSPTLPVSSPRWRDLLRQRQVWTIVVARCLTDPIWWLYITWLPKYLFDARGFNLAKIAMFAWAPYVAADAGSLLGGWLSGHLIKLGWSVDRARKSVIALGALMMPAGILAAFASSPMVALALIGAVLFGFQVWINNVQTLPGDFFPDRAVASVAGLGGTGAGIGSMIFILTTGWVVDHFSYVPVLVAAGLLAPIGTAVLFMLSGKIGRISE